MLLFVLVLFCQLPSSLSAPLRNVLMITGKLIIENHIDLEHERSLLSLPPNVVSFHAVDDLRPQLTHAYGMTELHTPNLDKFSKGYLSNLSWGLS